MSRDLQQGDIPSTLEQLQQELHSFKGACDWVLQVTVKEASADNEPQKQLAREAQSAENIAGIRRAGAAVRWKFSKVSFY